MATMHETIRSGHSRCPAVWLLLLAATAAASGSGCTSVIGSAYLREAWLDAMEHAAEEGPGTHPGTSADDARRQDSSTATDGEAAAALDVPDEIAAAADASPLVTLAEAIAAAERRLSATGGLGPAARDALTATLQATPRQDWPIVIDEFAAALVAAAEAAATAPAPSAAPAPAVTVVSQPPALAEPAAAAPAAPEPVAEPPALAIQNACFASRVRAWSVVDRFESAEFRPGQDVIVYFELDQLAALSDERGHTTRVETVLRLVDAAGRRLHEWSFEPLEETCGNRRRDYFARYLIAIPPTAPAGRCRLEIAATDAIGGRTAQATLPLDVIER